MLLASFRQLCPLPSILSRVSLRFAVMARTPAAKRGSTPVKSEAKLAKAKKVLETPSPRKSPRKGSAAAAEPDQEEREPVSTPALDPEAKSADAQPAKASTSKAIKETPASKEKKSKAAPVVPPPRPPPTVFAPGVGDGKSLVLASWNVNGLKAILSKDPKPIETFLQEYNPDVLCLQETKCGDGDIPAHAVFKGYQAHWSGGVKKGYAGTGMLTKNKPLKVTFGIGQKKHDEEGRVITAEFDSFFLVNAYVPNSGQELKRLPYRTNEWEPDMVTYLRSLDARKPVVYCGDLNAAHHPIDVTYPTRWSKNAGFTPVERACLSTLLADTPLVDSFRHFHPDTIKYSYFGYRGDCRAKHVGWRLDYFLVSPRAMAQVQESDILHQTTGSDHTPIVMRCTL